MADINTNSPTATQSGDTSNASGAGQGEGASTDFPSDIETIAHWVKFSSFEYSRENRNKGAVQGPFLERIRLPVPANLRTGYKADYSNEELGFMGNFGADVAGIGSNVYSILKGRGKGKMRSVADELGVGIKDVLKQIPGAAIAHGLDTLGAAGQGAANMAGVARNPQLAALYKGTEFRNHQFEYNFSPRTAEESQALYDIIYIFKYAMAPERQPQNNYLFEYPDEWEIQFADGARLFDIGPSVLTQFDVNYHAQGKPSYFHTGYPTNISMSMTFMETNIIFKEDITGENR